MYDVLFKFYSVEERLPNEDGKYFCIDEVGCVQYLDYSTKYKLFNVHHNPDTAIKVNYWAIASEMFDRLREISYRNYIRKEYGECYE